VADTTDLREVARVMYEQSRTGVLEVTGADGPVEIHLKEGKVVHAVPPPGSDWLLGHVLVESGTVPEKKLFRLLRRQRKTGRPLESLLIEQELVTRDILGKYLDLQIRETVLPLFLREDVTTDFRDEPPVVNDLVRPVPIPFLLKEVEKRAKEWPILRRLGLTLDEVYDKTGESIGRFLVDDAPDVPGGQLGASERLAYYYVNGHKTVRQVAFASCLGEFEALRALALLKRRGFVNLREKKGRGEEAEVPTIWPRLVTVAFSLVLAALVAGLVLVQPAQLRQLFGALTGSADLRSGAVLRAQEAELRTAIDLHFALLGRYPQALPELAAAGVLPGEQLAALLSGGWRYEADRETYSLAPGAGLLRMDPGGGVEPAEGGSPGADAPPAPVTAGEPAASAEPPAAPPPTPPPTPVPAPAGER
jgi:hypothetical protein